jgi:coenzyme F420-0:L-glutamate ligase/coenzyme F420-1:gamma-L-glutamate ligase
MTAATVMLTAVPGIPLIEPGDDLAGILIEALRAAGIELRDGDVVVLAQKIVSKAEGRYVNLDDVIPSTQAIALAGQVKKDPRFIEAVLGESVEIVRYREGLLITEHRLGFVMANAGVDQSNIEHPDGRERILLLPEDPDGSCAKLKRAFDGAFEADVGVIMNDSFGRPLRNGVVGVAIGAAGMPCLCSLIGDRDLFGRTLRVTEVAFADEIASAASMVMGQAGEGRPVVHIRGLNWSGPPAGASELARRKQRDMFR